MHVNIEPQTCGDLRLQVLPTSKLDTPNGSISMVQTSELNDIHEDATIRCRELSLDKLPTLPPTRVQIRRSSSSAWSSIPRFIANGVAAGVAQVQDAEHHAVADSSKSRAICPKWQEALAFAGVQAQCRCALSPTQAQIGW